MTAVRIEETVAIKLIYSMLLLMCRNPAFDCLGIFPKIGNTFRHCIHTNVNQDFSTIFSTHTDSISSWKQE